MVRARFWLFPFVLALIVAAQACRSSDKAHEASAVKSEPAAGEAAAHVRGADPCTTRPEPAVCCEALIPSCNDCREKNRKHLEDWKAKCEKPQAADADCGQPPVISCCSDETEECRQCRASALNQMMAWKAKCGEEPAHSCDRAPPQVACCEALIPSCDACRERNQRVQQEWQARCR